MMPHRYSAESRIPLFSEKSEAILKISQEDKEYLEGGHTLRQDCRTGAIKSNFEIIYEKRKKTHFN